MVNYSCEKCGKPFTQKSHYDAHMSKKTPCVYENKLKEMVKEIVKEELKTEETSVNKAPAKQVVKKAAPLKPMVKWSGGKKDEIKSFAQYIPTTFNTYLEPFVGGGALFFHLRPSKSVISDLHQELVDFYKSIKRGYSQEIYNFMASNKNEEEAYYNVRDNLVVANELDNAKRFYYLRKTCYRGMLRYNKSGKFNIPFGRYKTYKYENLKNKDYEELLKGSEILNKSFEYVFANYNFENNFMFLDPPYDSKFTDYGYCTFEKKDHKKLAKCFKETKIKCLMIIGKTKFIEELYKGYIVDEYDKKYRFKLHSGRVGNEINTKHLIVKNY